MLDRDYVPDLGRVLYSRETGFAPDAPESVKQRPLVVPDMDAPVPPDPWTTGRTKLPTPRRARGVAFMAHVTIEAIRELHAKGMTLVQVAAELGCSENVITARRRSAGDVDKKHVAKPKGPPKLAYHPRKLQVTIEKIRALQARGMVAEQIATRLGCHADTIYARIREANGGATRPKQKLTPEQRVSIVQRRGAGEKAAVLAVEFGITPNRVYELCKALKETSE